MISLRKLRANCKTSSYVNRTPKDSHLSSSQPPTNPYPTFIIVKTPNAISAELKSLFSNWTSHRNSEDETNVFFSNSFAFCDKRNSFEGEGMKKINGKPSIIKLQRFVRLEWFMAFLFRFCHRKNLHESYVRYPSPAYSLDHKKKIFKTFIYFCCACDNVSWAEDKMIPKLNFDNNRRSDEVCRVYTTFLRSHQAQSQAWNQIEEKRKKMKLTIFYK